MKRRGATKTGRQEVPQAMSLLCHPARDEGAEARSRLPCVRRAERSPLSIVHLDRMASVAQHLHRMPKRRRRPKPPSRSAPAPTDRTAPSTVGGIAVIVAYAIGAITVVMGLEAALGSPKGEGAGALVSVINLGMVTAIAANIVAIVYGARETEPSLRERATIVVVGAVFGIGGAVLLMIVTSSMESCAALNRPLIPTTGH